VLSIESADAAAALQEISKLQDEKEEPKDRQNEELIPLKGERFKDFAMWFKDILSGRVTTVTETTRLSNSPAVIVDHESAAFRRAMRFVDPQRAPQLPKQQIQINPKHPIIIKLDSLRHAEPELAKEIAEQILDNALIQAGLLDDGRSMIPRLQKILDTTLSSRLPKSQQTQAQSQTQSQAQQPQEQTQQQ
jgi:TNF receptor-associated protein 1